MKNIKTTTTINSAGAIYLRNNIRKALDLNSGDKVSLEVVDGALIIKVNTPTKPTIAQPISSGIARIIFNIFYQFLSFTVLKVYHIKLELSILFF